MNNSFVHHANIASGVSVGELVAYIEHSTDIHAEGNPDFIAEEYDVFGIPESRRLKEFTSTKAINANGVRIFVLSCNSLTREAQNALLKLLEEPKSKTFFYFLLPSADMLLDTLRSRMQKLILPKNAGGARNAPVGDIADNFSKNFLSGTPAERSAIIQKIIKEKDKNSAMGCVKGLIRVLHEKNKFKNFDALNELQKTYSYLGDRSSSIKLLLEHLAVVLPRVS